MDAKGFMPTDLYVSCITHTILILSLREQP